MKFGRNLCRYQVPEWAPFYINYNGFKRLCKLASTFTTDVGRRNTLITYQTVCDLGLQERIIPLPDTTDSNRIAIDDRSQRVLGKITFTSGNKTVTDNDVELIVINSLAFGDTSFDGKIVKGSEVGVDFQELCAALSREISSVERFYCDKYSTIQRKARAKDHGIRHDFSRVANLDELDQSEIEYLLGTCIGLREGIKKLMWYGKVNRDGIQKIFQKLDKVQLSCGLDLKPAEAKLSKSQFASQKECRKNLDVLNERIADFSNALFSGRSRKAYRSLALENFCTRAYPTLSYTPAFYEAITKDDASELDHILQTTEKREPGGDFQALVLALLRCSVGCGSRLCIEKLLSRAESLKDDKFHNNILHNLVIRIGQERASNAQGPQQYLRGPHIHNNEEPLPLLIYILERLRLGQWEALLERDSFGRLPLHYAAEYGLSGACQAILKRMHDCGLSSAQISNNPVLFPDLENHTPLHLAMIGGYPEAGNILLGFYGMTGGNHRITDSGDLGAIFGELLAIALKSDFLEIVQLLVGSNRGINHRGKHGETALHIAVRSGREDYVKLLLNRSADVEALETIYGWSPLIISCVKGHMHIVDILLEAGANQSIRDLSGWTARDHAAFRGYTKIAVRLFAPSTKESASIGSNGSNLSGTDTQCLRTPYALRNSEFVTASRLDPRLPIKKSQVLVNLGSYASNKKVKAVDLSPYISLDSSTSHPETGYSITISAIGAIGPSHVVQLPILENMTNIPRLFSARNPGEVKLVFHVFREAPDTGEDILVGSGIALLNNLKQGLGVKRESLMRDYTIPILEKDTLIFMGTVTFNFVIITPLPQPDLPPIATEKLWSWDGPTKIVGHRGLGQNLPSHKYPQIGENSIRSFLTAVGLGASYVELDVQLTKDHIPVIYHDFLVSETGTDAPLHTLSLAQFMHIPRSQAPPNDLPSLSEMRYLEKSQGRRNRSYSLNAYEASRTNDLNERMKHTFDYKLEQSKPNTRGNYIHEPFTTVQELLERLPMSIPLNMEIKYPTLFEATDEWEMETFAIELNLFVNTILTSVITHASTRPIMFSSFSPEICILLSLKQTRYPVLFLNAGGCWPTGDIRASSLQEAVHFANAWKLDGVVVESDPLVLAPRLVGFVRDRGLVCASYGALNNEPEFAKIQADAGLNVLIVDKVRLISEALSPKAPVS